MPYGAVPALPKAATPAKDPYGQQFTQYGFTVVETAVSNYPGYNKMVTIYRPQAVTPGGGVLCISYTANSVTGAKGNWMMIFNSPGTFNSQVYRNVTAITGSAVDTLMSGLSQLGSIPGMQVLVPAWHIARLKIDLQKSNIANNDIWFTTEKSTGQTDLFQAVKDPNTGQVYLWNQEKRTRFDTNAKNAVLNHLKNNVFGTFLPGNGLISNYNVSMEYAPANPLTFMIKVTPKNAPSTGGLKELKIFYQINSTNHQTTTMMSNGIVAEYQGYGSSFGQFLYDGIKGLQYMGNNDSWLRELATARVVGGTASSPQIQLRNNPFRYKLVWNNSLGRYSLVQI